MKPRHRPVFAALGLAWACASCSDAPDVGAGTEASRPQGQDTPGGAADRAAWVAAQLPPAQVGPQTPPALADALGPPGSNAANAPNAPNAANAANALTAAAASAYTYVGKWSHDGRTFVYLQRGEARPVMVSAPGPLDAETRVQSIDAHRLVLAQPARGRQWMIDLDAVVANRVAAAPRLPVPPAESTESAMPDN